jgi:hypothetical protein
MKWSQSADRRVVEAVVAVFNTPADALHTQLSELTEAQWQRSYYWLDASGMALYLLDRIVSQELEDAMPLATLERLRQNLADNQRRTESMRAEYAELNREFEQTGINYCNLKGFTLTPHSCPDSALRCQLDFDFLVDGKDLESCREILARRGYTVCGATNAVWEFKTETDELANIADHYKPKKQRCVEVHFACGSSTLHLPVRDERLDRVSWVLVGDQTVPALSSVDQFFAQATHLFGHLCDTSTRLAWVLEFTRHIETRYEDREFWSEVAERTAVNKQDSIALGCCCLLAKEVFGARIPDALETALNGIPANVAAWLRRYGRRALLADFPGTKLYLLLREQLNAGDGEWKQVKHRMLVPRRRAPRIVHVGRHMGLTKRLRAEIYQLRFELFRLRFHIVEGLRYMAESVRWKRYLEDQKTVKSSGFEKQVSTTVGHS